MSYEVKPKAGQKVLIFRERGRRVATILSSGKKESYLGELGVIPRYARELPHVNKRLEGFGLAARPVAKNGPRHLMTIHKL